MESDIYFEDAGDLTFENETMSLEDTLINFNLINEWEILEFIDKHVGLVSLINSTYYLIRKYFKEENLSLEFISDYENPSSSILEIGINASDGDAGFRISKFFDEWDYFSQDDDVRGRLTIRVVG